MPRCAWLQQNGERRLRGASPIETYKFYAVDPQAYLAEF
jgi:hypothetical protein